MKKKILILSLLFFIALIIFFNFVPKKTIKLLIPLKFYTNLKLIIPQNIFAFAQVIFENKRSTLRLNNDYNEKFIPKTQFINLNFKKIKIDFNKTNISGYAPQLKKGGMKTFFMEYFDSKIFIITKNAEIFYTNIENLKNKKIFKIENNLKEIEVLDFKINKKSFFITGFNSNNKCKELLILKSNLNFNQLKFNIIKRFGGCFESIQAGKMQFYNKTEKILISTAADILKNDDETDNKPQNINSPYGKILLFDPNVNETKVFSYGHRNILGLYADDKIILATENGPAGGDEINKIELHGNYGWPIASYGEKYSHDYTETLNYKKNHENLNFIEPIFAFVPSIGISEIIKLDNNFSKLWVDNFLISSLNSKHIYRVKFDNQFKSIKFYEKIFINERIRDMIYLKESKIILLALEETGSIGILQNINN